MTEALNGPAPSSSKLSRASLALAIVAVAVFWSAYLAAVFHVLAVGNVLLVAAAVAGVVLGAGAVATGVVARRRVKRGIAAGRGVALAGIVLGVVAVVLPALVLAALAFVMYSSYEEFESCVKGSGHPSYMCLKECPPFLESLCRSEIRW